MAKAPRVHAPPSSIAYSTLGKYGDVGIYYNARARPLETSNRNGCGTWWPDYGPTTRDFSYMKNSHPTDSVFENVVQPFCQNQINQRRLNGSYSDVSGESSGAPQQFRHPAPQREALYSSTIVLPYKKGGRRKVDDDNHWKGVVGGSKKYPIWCKGPLLNDPDRHQVHPLTKGFEQNLAASCTVANLAAGTPTGTAPCDNLQRTVSCPALDPSSSTLLSPACGSSLARLPGVAGGTDVHQSLRDPSRRSMAVPGGGDKPPSWLAKRTIATRDFDAAGHAGCLLKKLPIELQS
eukprot:TRINITY_DN64974_c0_g1_i1.p1 TRINITY_DN64974_c0_g1~~TRINITY_DN64974_c0_g1_i1.p1  ORF type:complete len:292 (-),score=36.58 TRINITY_DN64974_c0_g1_i1:104-979(-)